MKLKVIGHIVHFEGERDRGAYVTAFAGTWVHAVQAMMESRPGVKICIEPVTAIPEWAQNNEVPVESPHELHLTYRKATHERNIKD